MTSASTLALKLLNINPSFSDDEISTLRAYPFAKMQGAGNDFIVIDALTRPLFSKLLQQLNDVEKNKFIQKLCDRHYGIGADQFLIIEKTALANCDFKYRIFNQDGSEVEHCGNGARCFARYVFDHGLTHKTTIRVEVMKGMIELSLTDDLKYVNVTMSAPRFLKEDIPFNLIANNLDANIKANDCLEIYQDLRKKTLLNHLSAQSLEALDLMEGKPFGRFYQIQHPSLGLIEFSIASMGNPHLLIDFDRYCAQNPDLKFNRDFWQFDLATLAQYLQNLPAFYEGVNVGFIQIQDTKTAALRVYERGSGETLACGTGACAAVVLSILAGVLDCNEAIKVKARGGELYIKWPIFSDSTSKIAPVMMTGAANYSFKGVVDLEDFC